MKRNKKNNKGFSLIELVAAVAILMIVVIPLLQAFTTSASLTSKAKKIGEATAAAQNIQETIEALSVKDFQNLDNKNVASMLETMGDSVERSETTENSDGSTSMTVTNLKSGSGTYDAKVTFSLGSENYSGIGIINNTDIAKYTNLETAFVQCGSTGLDKNPDDQADTEYMTTDKYKNDNDSIKTKSRRIVVEIKTEEDTERNVLLVYEKVSFCYIYGNKGYTATNYQASTNGGKSVNNIKRNSNYNEDDPTSTYYEGVDVEIDYDMFPNGHEMSLEKDDEGAYKDTYTAYLMYYPYFSFQNDSENGITTKDDDYIEFLIDTNDDNQENAPLNTQFFVVKMWPLERETVDETSASGSSDTSKVINWKPVELGTKDSDYKVNIIETRNKAYNNYVKNEFDNNILKMGIRLYTNVRCNLKTGKLYDAGDFNSRFAYKVRLPAKTFTILDKNYTLYDVKVNDEIRYEDALVKHEKEDRLYSVKIEIYDSGKIDDGKAVHTLEANKLT